MARRLAMASRTLSHPSGCSPKTLSFQPFSELLVPASHPQVSKHSVVWEAQLWFTTAADGLAGGPTRSDGRRGAHPNDPHEGLHRGVHFNDLRYMLAGEHRCRVSPRFDALNHGLQESRVVRANGLDG